MKVTKKVIEQLGGLPVHHEEGGGCYFYYGGDGRTYLSAEDMPKKVDVLIFELLRHAYLVGKKDGRKEFQKELKVLIGTK